MRKLEILGLCWILFCSSLMILVSFFVTNTIWLISDLSFIIIAGLIISYILDKKINKEK